MNKLYWRWVWLWGLATLLACAAPQVAGLESADAGDEGNASSFEEACTEEHSLLVLCDESQCGLYPCREVMDHLSVAQVVPTRGGALPRPSAQRAQRYWGSSQGLPQDTQPVFVIPWRHEPPLLPSQTEALEEAAKERRKPHEQHHIFPRAFREWFAKQGIHIDEYVMPLEVEKHRSIHRGERGGPWNEAWRRFILNHLAGAPREEIYRYAGQLIYEFELFGPVVPYWRQPPPVAQGY